MTALATFLLIALGIFSLFNFPIKSLAADIKLEFEHGKDTNLHTACRSNDADRVKSILEALSAENAQSYLNAVGEGGQTALMAAVLGGADAVVPLLLEAGADPAIGEKDGYTPMHGAGFQGRANIAKMLIEFGLDPSDRHKDGFTPIHRAAKGSSKVQHA